LFVTINPADTYHPLLGVLGGLTVERWQEMTGHERTVFVARNPGPAAQFFDVMINAFLNIIVRHGDKNGGLFGASETYYGMVEAQGRGTLHCHMLIWIEGNPGPQELRQCMTDDQGYQLQMFNWIESIIQCDLPGMNEILEESGAPLPRPALPKNEMDPRMKDAPQIADMEENEFAKEFQIFVGELATRCNWHEHKSTCWKHLKSGEKRGDPTCRMRIDGKTRSFTELDTETQSILIKRLHPRINNFNDVVIFLLQCNMDIKYIGSGEAAKALIYYVTDYITKENLATHVGLEALAYAIKQNDAKYYQDDCSLKSEKGKSLFIKTVNAMMGRQEMSHQQVLSYFIGSGDHYKANMFRLLKWGEVDRYICSKLNERPWNKHDNANSEHSEQYGEYEKDSTTKYLDDDNYSSDNNDDLFNEEHNDGYKDEITLQVDNESIIPTNGVMDYCFRSHNKEYDDLSLWEHTEWVRKITKQSETKRKSGHDIQNNKHKNRGKRKIGKKPTARGDFSSGEHTNFDTHTNRLREIPYVPVLLGEALPCPDRGPEEKEQWHRAMIILFKPWRTPTDLKGGHTSWMDAFKSTKFKPSMIEIMKNLNVENECKDARWEGTTS